MKLKRGCILSAMVLLVTGLLLVEPVCAKSEPGVRVDKWIRSHFANPDHLPFTFKYGGVSSTRFMGKWKCTVKKLPATDPDQLRYNYIYTDPETRMKIECKVTGYPSFQAVEWVLNFLNGADRNSPSISDVRVVDLKFLCHKKGDFILHHNNGSMAQKADFNPIDEKLQDGKEVYIAPKTGRSSEDHAFPFFNIEFPDSRGVIVSIGWTGNWYASILQPSRGQLNLHTGMENMNLFLYPGEKIRTPLCSLMFWEGKDRMTGHNQFRHFILAHHSRKINGKFAEYPLSGGFNWGDPYPCNEYGCLTEIYARALIDRYKQFAITPEVFWLDAGWYKGCGDTGWGVNVGNWVVDRTRFPRGLKPVSDEAHRVGAKFMVWFEPERVYAGTLIDQEHPDWLLKLSGNDTRLFNMGNPVARLWLTNMIAGLIRENGIDYYRQDFNIQPAPYWKKYDPKGRTGITEIRYVEGLYAFWDSLLVRFPHLLIDNCASGGRRLDLETVTRSAPLWRTDYSYGEPDGYQNHTYGLNFYLPLSGTGLYAADPYSFRSSLSSAMVVNWKITDQNISIPEMQRCVQEFKLLRPYYYGDYYPLTPAENLTQENIWLSYQLNRPERGDGIILAFRRKENETESIRVKLKGLVPVKNYELYDDDSKQKKVFSGEQLMDGFDLTIKTAPGSLLIKYHAIN
jgi:alpha-galactosidase